MHSIHPDVSAILAEALSGTPRLSARQRNYLRSAQRSFRLHRQAALRQLQKSSSSRLSGLLQGGDVRVGSGKSRLYTNYDKRLRAMNVVAPNGKMALIPVRSASQARALASKLPKSNLMNSTQLRSNVLLEGLLTARALAAGPQPMVEVIKSGFVGASGVKNDVKQIWQGEKGQIIGDDGNNFTAMLSVSGRIVFPKAKFEEYFQALDPSDINFQPE